MFFVSSDKKRSGGWGERCCLVRCAAGNSLSLSPLWEKLNWFSELENKKSHLMMCIASTQTEII